MRWIMPLALLTTAAPLHAENLRVESRVLLERADHGALRLEPAERFGRGDRVVTVLSWSGRHPGRYTITSALPPGLALQSVSGERLQVSTDGGRSWRVLADPREAPQGVTHLRWRIAERGGSLSYRAIVR